VAAAVHNAGGWVGAVIMVAADFPARPGAGPDWTGYAPLDAPFGTRLLAALADIGEGLRRWRAWTYLAVESVKNQYRRTVLGPWWLTLQTAAYVVGLAVIFGQILHTGLRGFLPYVAVGLICFNLLAGLTRAGANVFVGASSVMKSTRQPLTSFVMRDVTIEFIQFGHNMLIYIVFLASGLVAPNPKMFIALGVVLLIAINGLFCGLWLGPMVARFRDVNPLVMSVLQVLVFFTPVFYRTANLHGGDRSALLAWNPFTYLLGAFRAPLIDAPLRLTYFGGAVIITLANILLGLVIFARSRSRLPYWVA
jgi:lipopolysaccharide transport system permease protein